MTLEQAIAILNEKKHRGFYDWQEFSAPGEGRFAEPLGDFHEDHPINRLSEFEVIAIAEKYQKQGAKMPYLGGIE